MNTYDVVINSYFYNKIHKMIINYRLKVKNIK